MSSKRINKEHVDNFVTISKLCVHTAYKYLNKDQFAYELKKNTTNKFIT